MNAWALHRVLVLALITVLLVGCRAAAPPPTGTPPLAETPSPPPATVSLAATPSSPLSTPPLAGPPPITTLSIEDVNGCASDPECLVITAGYCDGAVAIHKDYQDVWNEYLEAWLRQQGRQTCPETAPLDRYEAKCVNTQCLAVERRQRAILSFSAKPLLNQAVTLQLAFRLAAAVPLVSARIELPDGFELVSGSLEWQGEVGGSEGQAFGAVVKATRPGYYQVKGQVFLPEDVDASWLSDTIYVEVSSGDAIFGSKPVNNWDDRFGIPVPRNNQQIRSQLLIQPEPGLNKEFAITYRVILPPELPDPCMAQMGIVFPLQAFEVIAVEYPPGGELGEYPSQLSWMGNVSQSQTLELKVTLKAISTGWGHVFGFLDVSDPAAVVNPIMDDALIAQLYVDQYSGSYMIEEVRRVTTAAVTPVVTSVAGLNRTWRGEYYANRDLSGAPLLVREDEAVDFDWGAGSPGSGMPADEFSVRWNGDLNFAAGNYRFHASVDDGVRLWLDGELVLDKWFETGAAAYTVDVTLSEGWHSLQMEYYEHTGEALARLDWEYLESYPDRQGEEMVLTAADVAAAYDIEHAFQIATNYGARPGIVTLDASDGPFTYYEEDRSINVFYSDLTLRSLNGAVISNCADGVFFDNFPIQDVTIQGITFQCSGSGIAISPSNYEHEGLVIEDNVMEAGDYGITVTDWQDVTIRGNRVSAREDIPREAIYLVDTSDALVVGNQLSGYRGVTLDNSDANQVVNNDISARWQGMLLTEGSDDNKIIANQISGPQSAGIALGAGTTNNKVRGNHVVCAAGGECLTVDASTSSVWENNEITGNQP